MTDAEKKDKKHQATPAQPPRNFNGLSKDELLNIIDNDSLGRDVLTIGEKEAVKKAVDTSNSNTGNLENKKPKKDLKRAKHQPILEEKDIIEYMFKEWFMKGMDWLGNTLVVCPLEYASFWIADRVSNWFDGSGDIANPYVNEGTYKFKSNLEHFFKKEKELDVARVSAPEAKIKAVAAQIKAGNIAGIEDLSPDVLAQLKTKVAGLEPKNKDEIKLSCFIQEAYSSQKVKDIAFLAKNERFQEIPQDLLPAAFVEKLKEKMPELQDDRALDGLVGIGIGVGLEYKNTLREATRAKMLYKKVQDSKNYHGLNFENEDEVRAMVDAEGQELDAAMRKAFKENPDKLFKLDKKEKTELNELNDLAQKAVQHEIKQINKGRFEERSKQAKENENLMRVYKRLGIRFNNIAQENMRDAAINMNAADQDLAGNIDNSILPDNSDNSRRRTYVSRKKAQIKTGIKEGIRNIFHGQDKEKE